MDLNVNDTDVEPVADAMGVLRDALDCEGLDLTVVECPPDWTGKAHGHTDQGKEEVDYRIKGTTIIAVDGEAVELSSGDARRVSAEGTRRIENGDDDNRYVIVDIA